MSKKNSQPQITRPTVTVKPGDQIMLGSSWYTVTAVEDDQILWQNGERDGKLPLKMVTQSMVRPGNPVPEVADDPDCRAVRDTLGSLAAGISKIVPDDDRERAAVILRLRGKDEHTLVLPPALKVVAAGEGWRAVKYTTPDDVAAAQAANDAVIAAQAPKFNGEHVIATDDTARKVGVFVRVDENHGTIRYLGGHSIKRPISLIRLADQPLTATNVHNDETDFGPGDLVYNVHDDEMIVGLFSADQWAGFAQILYPGNRTEQVGLGDVRAAWLPAAAAAASADDDDLIITDEDLAEDAAYTDEDLERLTGVPLPPVDDDELPPGEEQAIPVGILQQEQPTYRKGDTFRRRDGREFTIAALDGDTVHLTHRINGVLLDSCIPAAALPRLTLDAEPMEDDTRDELVDALTQRVRQLEDELARLHDEDPDTEPLAPETVRAAQGATRDLGEIEIIEIGNYVVESILFHPINLFDHKARTERNQEIARLRNADEKWYVVFEEAQLSAPGDTVPTMYHTARLERHLRKDDGDPGDGTPEHRDILDMASDVVNGYEPDAAPDDADSETIETETDLAPVPTAFRTTEYPITASIRMVGADAVRDFYNTQVCEAFNLARGRAVAPALSSEVTS